MAVYRPNRNGVVSKFYVYEFLYQGKRFQGSTGSTSKTVAKEYEKRRKAELERAAAGLPTEQKANRIRRVSEVVKAYLDGYRLTHRPSSIDFASTRLGTVERLLGTTGVIRPDRGADSGLRPPAPSRRRKWADDQHGAWGTVAGNWADMAGTVAASEETRRT